MMKKFKLPIVILLFIVLLTSLRLMWITSFTNTEQPPIVKGEFDLRNWDYTSDATVTLDGEWEFYPSVLLMDEHHPSTTSNTHTSYIHVPDGWDESLGQSGKHASFGYGTYRLRLLVNTDPDVHFSIRVPSIRSASEIYINGKSLHASGKPAADYNHYVAYNAPYTVSFATQGAQEIDIVIHVANFLDVRKGGIIRSMKLGTEEAIAKEVQLSYTMQLLMTFVFFIHTLYALILYVLRNGDRPFLYVALMFLFANGIALLGSDDKLLLFWLPINYEWSFRLMPIAFFGMAYFLYKSIQTFLPSSLRRPLSLSVLIAMTIATLLAAFLPFSIFFSAYNLLLAIAGIGIIFSIVALTIIGLKGSTHQFLFLLALIALISHFIWWGIFILTGTKIIAYPFDLIIAVMLFASVLFKHYFETYKKTEELAAKLQKIDLMKDEFLANTSHELRNPLHGMLNLAYTVLERERETLQAKSIQELHLVQEIGQRMTHSLNDLLDLLKFKDNTIHLHVGSVHLPAVVHGVFDILRYRANEKSLSLINEIPDSFPPVIADEKRLVQILFNLIHNAIKFTHVGEVRVQAEEKGQKAIIRIVDTGEGMEEGFLARMFTPYEQGSERAQNPDGGFGLGLSITKQLVELHGGTIHAESTLGKGTTFTFYLSLAENRIISGTDTESQASAPLPDPIADVGVKPRNQTNARSIDSQSASIHKSRVLVIDDDTVNLQVVESILIPENYYVVTVSSTEKALHLLETRGWDLIISDVMMPTMSGYEWTRFVRERYTMSELPILLLTARYQAEDITAGFLAGANDYVIKPVHPNELRARVRALTDLKRTITERLQIEAAYHQAQLQPHFIFNTLNSIVALGSFDIPKMNEMIGMFSEYLQMSFKLWDSQQPVSIDDEIGLIRAYLDIENIRFGERLRIIWDVPEYVNAIIPPLTIQPLVENAVKHGVLHQMRGVTVHIQITEDESNVYVTIRDDGRGMTSEEIEAAFNTPAYEQNGVGLQSIHKRLKQHCGNGLTIESALGEGTTCSFTVPKMI